MHTSLFHGLWETPEDLGFRRNDPSGVSLILIGPTYLSPFFHPSHEGWLNTPHPSQQTSEGSDELAYPRLVAMTGRAWACWLESSYHLLWDTQLFPVLGNFGGARKRNRGREEIFVTKPGRGSFRNHNSSSKTIANNPFKMNFEIWSEAFEKKFSVLIL